MLKREVGFSNDIDQEGPRAKRRKDSDDDTEDVTMSDPAAPTNDENAIAAGGSSSTEDTVKSQGSELWHTLKNAVNKEGRALAVDFLRRPSKRQYPDYYDLVQRPISLEEIKKQLDAGGYNSLEAIKEDLALCFKNAKQYNMKNSDIWKDAKSLHKLLIKEYNKMSGDDARDEDEAGEQGDLADGEGEDDKKRGKIKPANMNRLLKSRLQKLVNKTDDTGRVISTEFMELPNRKDWPFYYKEIKRPQCIENIFKHLKRKEYITSLEFATDVELVFSNAMTFNQEHTAIWEDALLLRDYFRQLMADLPAPHALPEYTKPSNGKIKLKMPASAQPPGPASSPALPAAQPSANSSGSLFLRVPAAQNKSQAPPATSPPAAMPTPPAPSAPLPATQAQSKTTKVSTTPQPSSQSLSYINPTFSHHYPNASYQPPVAASTAPANAPSSSTSHLPTANPISGVQASHSMSPAPAPIHPNHQLKVVSLKTEPRGRPFKLDYREGVKTWVMRLGHREKGLYVAHIRFLAEEENESAGEDEQDEQTQEKEEEEEEEDPEAEAPAKKKVKRGRGRPKGSTTKAGKTKATRVVKKPLKPPVVKLDEIQVKLNGSIVKEKEDQEHEWYVELPVGSSVVEIGEKGGLVWKVYAERIADALAV